MKKVLLLILIFTLAFSACTVTAFADETKIDEDFSVEFELSELYNYTPLTNEDASLLSGDLLSGDFCEYLTNALYNLEPEIDIAEYNLTLADQAEVIEAVSLVIDTNPGLYFVNPSFGGIRDGKNNLLALTFTYTTDSKEEVDTVYAQIEEEVDNILSSCVDDSMNDVQKLLAIHDHLILTKEFIDGASNYTPTAKDFLLQNASNYKGFTNAFYYIAKKANITGGFASGNGVWNTFYINGKWYHANLWMDEMYSEDIYAYVSHKWFLKSNDWLEINNEYDFTPIENSDTKYDDAFWNSVTHQIVTLAGHSFYITEVGANGSIYVYNSHTDTTSEIYKFTNYWGKDTDYYWVATYSGLAYHNGRLYFNTNDSIVSCNLDGSGVTEDKIISDGNTSIYSCYKDGDKLCYATGDLVTPYKREGFGYALPQKLTKDHFFIVDVFEKDGDYYMSYINQYNDEYNICVSETESETTLGVSVLRCDESVNTIKIGFCDASYKINVLNNLFVPLMREYCIL